MNELSIQQLISRLQDLNLQQSAVLAELRGRGSSERPIPGERSVPASSILFSQTPLKVGSRVRIANSVRTFGRQTIDQDRVGVVERITSARVHIRTDSGRLILRSPNNVSRLE